MRDPGVKKLFVCLEESGARVLHFVGDDRSHGSPPAPTAVRTIGSNGPLREAPFEPSNDLLATPDGPATHLCGSRKITLRNEAVGPPPSRYMLRVLACRTKTAFSLLRVVLRLRGGDGHAPQYPLPYPLQVPDAEGREWTSTDIHSQTRSLVRATNVGQKTCYQSRKRTAVDATGWPKMRFAPPAIVLDAQMMVWPLIPLPR